MNTSEMSQHPATLFTVVEGKVTDLDALEILEARLFDAEAFTCSDLRILLRHPAGFFRVAWAGEVIAGYVSVYGVGKVGYIASIAVDSPYQRRGLGTRLLDLAHVEFRRRGAATMKLHVRAANAPAIALYGKHGYVVEKLIPNYYGSNSPGLLMRRALET